MASTEWVLWGTPTDPEILPENRVPWRLTGGTLAHCWRERDFRSKGTAWADLVILAEGSRP